MLLRTVAERGVLEEHHVFAKAVQPYCGGLPENLLCVRPRVETVCPDPLQSSWLGYSALTRATRVRVPVAEF